MKKLKFSNLLNHPLYFFFWFFVGLAGLSLTFDFKSNTQEHKFDQSSEAIRDEQITLAATNYQDLQKISDQDLLRQLEAQASSAVPSDEPYAWSEEQIQDYEAQQNQSAQAVRNGFVYETIAEESINVDYEDSKNPKVCGPSRLYYEKQIVANAKLKELYTEREKENEALPKKCLIHVMNKFSIGGGNLGVCGKASGAVRTPGAKPCVSENLVNLTYNAYTDVMECLNLNPKTFLPKISRESGFLLNAYGSGKDGGIGQFTMPAIQAVNKGFDSYLNEMQKAAASKPACARIMKFKSLLTKASPDASQRCSMIGLPENPLRNVLYIGLFNRSHMDYFSGMKYIAGEDYFEQNGQLVPAQHNSADEFSGVFKDKKFKQSLEDLGIRNPNMHFFKEVLTLAGYNMGAPTSLRLFTLYLEKRKLNKKPLTLADFDFNSVKVAKDTYGDGKEKNVIDIARSFVMSSFIGRKDTEAVKAVKIKKRKQLPREWATSYLKTFPEFLTLNANNYDGKSINRYTVYGFPGYLSAVASRNQELRSTFNNAGLDPNYCSDPNFLVLKADE